LIKQKKLTNKFYKKKINHERTIEREKSPVEEEPSFIDSRYA